MNLFLKHFSFNKSFNFNNYFFIYQNLMNENFKNNLFFNWDDIIKYY